ncbi:DEAD/DEAH box helicase [Oceanivirga miroungae]|uniref:Transcription-repair-coupling factor n=1 Tax=Oceanivirga miroungae TaxID=1130046 RepID=A0A6I8M7M8_9FUSO|nr:DEAD/DEAH box helicase [Oceanivirga miroungae]VWL84820.1 transcription-repair coupling factor [Oceanivirga miroungae]
MTNLLKENVIEYLEKINKNNKIYISSSIKNLEYYYNKAILENKNAYLFKIENSDEKESLDFNIKLIECLEKDEKKYIFCDINLAMKVFFDKLDYFILEKGKEYSLKKIEEKLLEFSYEKEYIIDEIGKYSVRGDIIDIFSYGQDFPIRLDFFDIELEKIKYFDLETQKSFENRDSIRIFSTKLQGDAILMTTLLEKYLKNDVEILLENEELISYHVETLCLVEPENKDVFIQRYKELLSKSKLLNVSISENRNYKTEYDKLYSNKRRRVTKYKDVNELNKGDYVIHIVHGVGKYNGLEIINNKEVLSVSYKDRDKLYIPIESISRLEKYINLSNEEPSLYKLGTRGFEKRKLKYKEDIEKVAKKLIEVQAKRNENKGIIFSTEDVFINEFEEKFEYIETIDQLKAINDVKEDMRSPKMMDRIICGDVGYGKTEVAIRAAFIAAMNGYQVAVLAPTTILAMQHYKNFKKRFEDYPLEVEVYSRLNSNKKILENVENGKTNILIGTHKILSDKLEFLNLGLLIIDEEQKFGVKHKEKLKQKKEKLEVLTLTATPIPRTLNLALLGIRDISIIATPPEKKQPIKTEVIENITSERLREIILKEIAREGQVYYVSNDVKKMEELKKEIKRILPSYIKVEYINGQLNPKEIRKKIKDFEDEKFEVLIASTIIENGIDIPNANTIIIDNFTKLGLSQIYQLRGRVGRAEKKAYCYLLRDSNISSKAKDKELSMKTIEDITQGGYQIAVEDMNIRGAGEILGEKQSGVIESFGYDLYLKMLKEEIAKTKENKKEVLENVSVEIYNNGYIPNEYIKENERIRIYKRIYNAESIEEIKEIEKELMDRFGKMPIKTKELFSYVKIKIFAKENFIERIYEKKNKVIIKRHKNHLKNNETMLELNKEEFLKKVEE